MAEALQFGLVNRVVPRGRTREAGQQLAAQIAALPQACLRSDRMSALESVWLDDREAMAGEFCHGLVILGRSEMSEGVGRFRAGAGRGGADLDASWPLALRASSCLSVAVSTLGP